MGLRRRSEVEKAAVRYVQQGWRVLPGSAYDRGRFFSPFTGVLTDGVRPVVARESATTDETAVARWWAAGGRWVPSVLLCSWAEFRFVSMPRYLAHAVLLSEAWRSRPGPVLYRGDRGRAYFVVAGERRLAEDCVPPAEVEEMAVGEWVVAPPSRVLGVHVTWWIAPERVRWDPVPAELLRDALSSASPITHFERTPESAHSARTGARGKVG
ncbi:hypothetical protein GCM10011581_48380 [Saccharopolyspora subtropica]|uniref:DNA primase/polymerase bifunctional N-terminal domain-containing protein n=1 Tax=Saccharopolyspora thermophila TaxID=89367 RepID=A0A917NJQ7_9PSEU|nr:hypothetical protein GCM10011581_48380 [Saccharopolyspora subtropica]